MSKLESRTVSDILRRSCVDIRASTFGFDSRIRTSTFELGSIGGRDHMGNARLRLEMIRQHRYKLSLQGFGKNGEV